MTAVNTFKDLRDEVFRLHGAGALGEAVALLLRERQRFPDGDGVMAHWLLCFYALSGDTAGALRTLADALERGHWYTEPHLRDDPDVAALQGHPEYERLVALSIQRAHEYRANAVPSRLDAAPEGGTPPYPLLLALHGNNASARLSADYWRPALAAGWFLSLPTSSQATSSTHAVWNNQTWAVEEVQGHYRELAADPRIDPARVVVSGFSMGGRLALTLALGVLPVRGVIALGAVLGDGAERWLPAIEAAKQRGVRVCLLVGGDDDPRYHVEPTLRLAELLEQHGVPCLLKVFPGVGHTFPLEFAALLPELLAWAGGGSLPRA